MARKQKYKTRLDKYYHIAKSQGYRSRACFKLIQLNKKYDFLSKANSVIDLCSAPGGWLQVIQKFTPINSIKIGLDLDPIKPIPGCKTFVQDITTPECFQLLKRELNHQKCDVVLNDGAPNVGANWDKDAYSQNELCLHALRLACSFLRRGGLFITKVFRSKDYNALLWVFQKFFNKVEANKPLASRFTSAEIFVVCQDFIAPEIVDDKLFDAKFIFSDTEGDMLQLQLKNEVQSIDKIMQKRKKRSGYADDAPMGLFSKLSFTKFLEADNPFILFIEYNQFEMSEEEKRKYLPLAQPPQYWDEYIADLQLLGKREIAGLLKWRGKINLALRKLRKKPDELIPGQEKPKAILDDARMEPEEDSKEDPEAEQDWTDENEDEEAGEDDEDEEDDEDYEGEEGEYEDGENIDEEDLDEDEDEDEEELGEGEEFDEEDEEIEDGQEDEAAGMEMEEEEEEPDVKNKKKKENNKAVSGDPLQLNKKPEDSDSELENEIRKAQHQELKKLRKEREKKLSQLGKVGQPAQFSNNIEDEELFDIFKHQDLNKMDYLDLPEEQPKKLPKKISFKGKAGLEKNLEEMYESKQSQINERKKMKLHNEEDVDFDADEMKCEGLPLSRRGKEADNEQEDSYATKMNEKQQFVVKTKILNNKWFDRQLFSDVKSDLEKGNLSFQNPLNNTTSSTSNGKGQTLQKKAQQQKQQTAPSTSRETQFNREYDEDQDSTDQYDEDNEVDDEEVQFKKQQRQRLDAEDEVMADGDNEEYYYFQKQQRKREKRQQKKLLKQQQLTKKAQQGLPVRQEANSDSDEGQEDYDNSDDDEDQSNSDIFVDKSLLRKRKFHEDVVVSSSNRKRGQVSSSQYEEIDPDEKVPGEVSDDDAYKIHKPLSERDKRKLKLKKQRERKQGEEQELAQKEDGFEVVPEKQIEDYDVDSLAETLAIAKKMVRKRSSQAIINNSYSRHAVEDYDTLPKWFVEDEKKHSYKMLPVTKEEVLQEKERIYAINAKAPKKVMEAKIRRQRRLQKRMKKAKSKASQIMASEGVSENLKMQQISSLYKKELAMNKPEKRYVVSKKVNIGAKGKKDSRTVKHVDRRMKKDKRADKARMKRDPTGQKKLKSKTRQIRRHKGRKQKN